MAINYKKTKKVSVPNQNLDYDSRSKANVKRAWLEKLYKLEEENRQEKVVTTYDNVETE